MTKFLAPGLALAAMLVTALPAQATQYSFSTMLSGANELPANTSPAVGSATVTLDDASFMVRVQSSFSGLLGTTAQAHIHCCTAVPGAGNIDVATTLPSFAGFPLGISSGSFDRTYDFMQASSFNPEFHRCQRRHADGRIRCLADGPECRRGLFQHPHLDLSNGRVTRFPGRDPGAGTLDGCAFAGGARCPRLRGAEPQIRLSA